MQQLLRLQQLFSKKPAPRFDAALPDHELRRGLWLGALAVIIFALTFPMTRMAVGSLDAAPPSARQEFKRPGHKVGVELKHRTMAGIRIDDELAVRQVRISAIPDSHFSVMADSVSN